MTFDDWWNSTFLKEHDHIFNVVQPHQKDAIIALMAHAACLAYDEGWQEALEANGIYDNKVSNSC